MPRAATRRELLQRGIAAGGLTLVGRAVLTPAAAPAAVAPAPAASDADIVTRLLRLERLLLFIYENVLASSMISSPTRQALAPLQSQEEAHIAALTVALRRLGGIPPAGPANIAAANKDLSGRRVKGRLGQLRGQRDALRLLAAIEHVVVGAYYVSMLELADPGVLRLSAEIMGSEAQHGTVITLLLHPGVPTAAAPYALVQGRH
jgi:hypothetical protein